MSTLTSLAPTATTPGTLLALTGTGFLAGAIVLFNTDGQAGQSVAWVVSTTEIRCIVPDLPAGLYNVQVVNLDEAPSSGVAFTLNGIASPQELCTLDDLKSLMGDSFENPANDRQLGICLRMASAEIIRFCRRTFTVSSFTESLDGDGSNLLALGETPIVGVQALSIDGIAVDPTEARVYAGWLKFDDSQEYSARLRSDRRIFPCGAKNITVTYTAGYAEVPDDLAMACARQAIYIWNTLPKQGVVNENNQSSQASKSFALDGQLAPAVKSVALRYRQTKVGIV